MLHSRVGPQRCLCQWLCKQTEWELLTKQRSCAEIPAKRGEEALREERSQRWGAGDKERASARARARTHALATSRLCAELGEESGEEVRGAESSRNLGSFT